jgi:hypothetical protein
LNCDPVHRPKLPATTCCMVLQFVGPIRNLTRGSGVIFR